MGDLTMPDDKNKDKKTHEFDAEIFGTGTWTDAQGNRDKFTDQDLQDIIKNFDGLKETVKPPFIKLGHDAKQEAMILEGGQPALGWVKALKQVGDKLIATFTQVPDVVRQAIQSGLYKRISSELYFNYKHDGKIFNKVLARVALLGARIPAINTLADLEAYLSQSTSKGSFDTLKVYAFETDDAGVIINTETKEFSDMEKKEFESKIAELDAKAKQEETDRLKAETEAKEAKEQLAKFEQQQAEEKKTAEIEGIKTYCEEMVKAKKMLPYQRDLIVKDLDKRTYSTEDGHIFDFNLVKELFDKVDVILDVKEYAHDDKKKEILSPAEELEAKTKEYMREHTDVDYETASNIIFEKNPELAKAYARDEGGD